MTRSTWAIIAVATALGAPARAANDALLAGTARTVPAGSTTIGVFSALRYGLTDRLELRTHPLLDLVAPQLDATFVWREAGGFEIASAHGLLYPTPLMRLLSRGGTGGIVPADVRYPHILASSHHLLVSREAGGQLFTLRAGGRLARNLTAFDGPREWSEVEWHFVWPRTAAWFSGYSFDGGLAAEGLLGAGFGYRVDIEGFLMPGLRGDRALEWAVAGTWRRHDALRLRVGLRGSWARLPYGTRVSVPVPIVDLAWSFDGS